MCGFNSRDRKQEGTNEIVFFYEKKKNIRPSLGEAAVFSTIMLRPAGMHSAGRRRGIRETLSI